MTRTGFVHLEFDPAFNPSPKKRLRDGLSAVAQIGNTLWVANDESISLERLTDQGTTADGGTFYGAHQSFALGDYLRLPVPPPPDPKDLEEADVEGLDYHDGYLWVVGSHSLKRKNPDADDSAEKNIKRLAKVTRDGNRFLLARIPVAEEGGRLTLSKEVERGGTRRTSAQLRGDSMGNDLLKELREDDHLKSFLAIPGKDNGFDVEGLAVAGKRLFLGLRGPVLRGWAIILELEPEATDTDTSTLKLNKIGSADRRYRKHFLQLGGLGIRDLCVLGPDLLILAGPTLDLDGPVTVFRWPGGAQVGDESLLFGHSLPTGVDVPFGQGPNKGKDHPEGMTLFSPDGGPTNSVLVVYDAATDSRLRGTDGVEADIWTGLI